MMQLELDLFQMENIEKQNELVRSILLSGNSITPKEAMDKYEIYRLGARIYDLRDHGRGMKIKTEMVRTPNGKRFAKYSLENA